MQVLRHAPLGDNTAFYFIDMELCDFNLETYMHNDNILVNDHLATVSIIVQIVDGLIFIHDHGEVHRDITPQNSVFP